MNLIYFFSIFLLTELTSILFETPSDREYPYLQYMNSGSDKAVGSYRLIHPYYLTQRYALLDS